MRSSGTAAAPAELAAPAQASPSPATRCSTNPAPPAPLSSSPAEPAGLATSSSSIPAGPPPPAAHQAQAQPHTGGSSCANPLPAQQAAADEACSGCGAWQVERSAGSSSSSGSRPPPAAPAMPPTTPRRRQLQATVLDLSPILQAGAARRAQQQSRPRGAGGGSRQPAGGLLARGSWDGVGGSPSSAPPLAMGSRSAAAPSPVAHSPSPCCPPAKSQEQQLQRQPLDSASSGGCQAGVGLQLADPSAALPSAAAAASCSPAAGSSSSDAQHPDDHDGSSQAASVTLPLLHLLERPGSLEAAIQRAGWQPRQEQGSSSAATPERRHSGCEEDCWGLGGVRLQQQGSWQGSEGSQATNSCSGSSHSSSHSGTAAGWAEGSGRHQRQPSRAAAGGGVQPAARHCDGACSLPAPPGGSSGLPHSRPATRVMTMQVSWQSLAASGHSQQHGHPAILHDYAAAVPLAPTRCTPYLHL
jgi:hypothetical protein